MRPAIDVHHLMPALAGQAREQRRCQPAARSATGERQCAVGVRQDVARGTVEQEGKALLRGAYAGDLFTTVDSSMSRPTTATARPPSAGRTRLTVRLPVAGIGGIQV